MSALLLALSMLALGNAQAEGISFSAQIQPFLNQQCYACHLTGATSGGVNLEPGASFSNLVGIPSSESPLPRVTAGDPELSYLIHKLRGTHLEVGGSGLQMPMGGGQVSEEILDLVSQWITEGAIDN